MDAADVERLLAEEDASEAAPGLEHLREHVAELDALGEDERRALAPFVEELAGRVDADRALLEVAVLAPGLMRGRDPVRMLVRSSKGFRERWIGDAVAFVEHAHAAVGRDRPVEALRAPAAQPGRDLEEVRAELLAAYHALGAEEGGRLAAHALRRLDAERPRALEILHDLACHVPGALADVQPALAEACVWEQPAVYAGAGADTERILRARLERADENRFVTLRALAWIGSDAVVDLFGALPEDDRRATLTAGWHLDGPRRRELFAPECVAADRSGGVFLVEHPDRCGWCDSPLTALVRHADVAALPFCERCAYRYGPIFSDVDASGVGRWSAANERPAEFEVEEPYGFDKGALGLGERRRTPWEAHGRLLDWHATQVGGLPNWLQDADYPGCPSCARPMPFVAQVELAEADQYGEGIHYGFWCRDCRTGAVSFQQT